jgi:ATP-binding cassette subfamily C protein CydC
LYLGATAVDAGRLTTPQLAMLALAVMAAFEAVSALPTAYQYLGQTHRSGARLQEVTEAPPAVRYPQQTGHPKGEWNIDLRSVTFYYQGAHRPALDRIDLYIAAGRKVAVMGDTGAGKSTLLYLLARFEDPQEGSIRLAGQALADFAETDLRRAVCIIDQRSHIFSGTIRDNLLLARPDADDQQLWDALDVVRMRDFVSTLPEGLNTWVGEAGRLLSGGQAKRLAVGRLLLSEAPIWILDEPTEGLDAETADAMIKELLERGKTKTLMVVTHRAEVVQRFDDVVNLMAGRIIGDS